jgi:tetratricopeptide (TPR) repeat protein
MVVLVVGFAALSTMQAARVARERDRAEYEAAKARALNDFLQEALLAPDPIEGLGRDATVLQALDSAAARLSRERLVSPAVEASVRSAIGWAYFRLGLYDQSEPLLQAALAQSRTLPRADQSELAQNILRVAQLEARLARHAAAFPLFAEGLALTERVHGDRARQVGAALVPLGELQQSRGDTAAALASLGRAAAIFRERGDSAGLATVDSHLGILEYGRGNLQAAERHFRASLDYRRRLGDHPLVAEALVNLGALLEDLRRPADAEAMYREGLAIGTRALGDDHDMVTATLNNLGLLLGNQGRRFEAEELLRRALAADERKLGPDHPAVAVDLGNLARVACTEPPSADGLSLAERAVRLQTMHAGAEAWETGQARVFVGQCHAVGRRFDDAERELRAGLRLIESALGTGHWRADSARARLAQLDRLRRRAGITR